MSAAAIPGTPTRVRSQHMNAPSADRPQTTPARSDMPPSPRRQSSQSQAHTRSASASAAPPLANVARNDFEQSNVAQPPSSSRHRADAPARSDSTRNPASASQSRYHPQDMPSSSSNGTHAAPAAGTNVRRRTTIDATTGHWDLGKTIGAGSMGKVKLARNKETGEQVAVKIVPRGSTDEHRNAQDRERADHSKEVRTAREAAIVTLVDHPYICGMRDVVRTNYHWYMLFEYVNGGQMLDYIISHGRLKEKQARKFGRQIASALDYCHRNSIVHRDLKIENILISKTGDIKIIDFGLSNTFSPKSLLKTFCGSLYFAAPELLQAKAYTGPEVDVWSFGIVLYVLVCGKVPFDDQSMPQLHAKIKKGAVEYPPWLSAECKNLIARMLVTDPSQRATLAEIMAHPWMTKGFGGPPENYLPPRKPLQLPLDPRVLQKMDGFDFGSAEYIEQQLTKIIQSEEYQKAVVATEKRNQSGISDSQNKQGGMFDFYKRRKSTTSRDTLTGPSSEAVQLGTDPLNAYNPLLSVYFLAKEKIEREEKESNPGALSMPRSPGEKPLQLPDLQPPAAAYTNTATYEMAGEAPTGGRSRPRARTHGEDELQDDAKKARSTNRVPPVPSPAIVLPPPEHTPVKKESAAVGLLRRLSTRRHKDPERPAPAATGDAYSTPRKSFSMRRQRDTSANRLQAEPVVEKQTETLLTPTAERTGLGRSTSVSAAEHSRNGSRRGVSEGSSARPVAMTPQPTRRTDRQYGDASSDAEASGSRTMPLTSRTKSMGHGRKESFQARRARRMDIRTEDVPEETDQDLREVEAVRSANSAGESPNGIKPVYLKGLFSVSTTSSKPLAVIRTDIIRVLKQLGVEYREIKGGFSCRHAPSIDMEKPKDEQAIGYGSHRRKISFGGLMGGSNNTEPSTPTPPRPTRPRRDNSYTASDSSDDDEERRTRGQQHNRAAGETSTHVQSDLGEGMVLKFEIFVVKVPLLSLHGIQFKKVDGGTWQYKNMAQTILNELKL
ncbi:Pkinase-domain-containing protein [Aureobasidium pullulans]|nr:Pkinase-domain-containing protein [Aureobasidium pullulans]THW86012.1 Pkinase-domain-containing protein [Aureobasidium pullulans]